MDRHSRSQLNIQIYEEACEWFVECRAGDLSAAARREFNSWLWKSPERLSAYLEIAAIWNEGPNLDPAHKWDVDTLIAQASEVTDNIVLIPTATTVKRPAEGTKERLPRRGLLAIAASVAAIVLVGGAITWSKSFGASVYTTATGEQRSIELPDGSTVDLNSRSKVRVRYAEHERYVELLKGEALFHVAKDRARPFIVVSASTHVRAVGTQFDVYKRHDGTVVSVMEGRVAVFTSQAVAGAGESGPAVDTQSPTPRLSAANGQIQAGLLLSAGEQVTVTPKDAQRSAHPNIAGVTAWKQRQIVFDSASLADVAEEFNRYSERRLIIEDPDLYGFHISGVFSSTDCDALLRFLRERPGVRVTETASEIRITKDIS